jgi:branched-chain amino acid transport system ATP-binding protein
MSSEDGNAAQATETSLANGATSPATAKTVLELRGITAGYGRTTVLRDVDISVPPGQIVALLGPNGAGKTTLLRVASGLLHARGGEVLLHGETANKERPFQRARAGLCLVPEGRGIFPNLSVKDNLLLQVPPWKQEQDFEPALEAFPVLRERLKQTAGSMSGGQQQMLALSRCFLAEPNVVLLDEVSMGLAPRIIDEIFEALEKLSHSGASLLLVEQYVGRALKAADKLYLLGRGSVTFSGTPSDIDEAELMRRYMGEHHAVDTLDEPPVMAAHDDPDDPLSRSDDLVSLGPGVPAHCL